MGKYPLLPLQRGMLTHQLIARDAADKAGYDIEQLCIALPSIPDATLLTHAWNDTIDRHGALRAAFSWDAALVPFQQPRDQVQVALSIRQWTRDGADAARAAFLREDRNERFDPTVAPLLRLTLARIGADSAELHLTFHHILMDERSMVLVLHEVFARYQQLLAGLHSPYGGRCERFFDFTSWQASLDPEPALAYFRELLRGKQAPTPLPLAEPATRPLADTGHGVVALELPPALRLQLESLAKPVGGTLGEVLQAAWALLQYRLTGDADVVFGMSRSLRDHELGDAIDDVVGLLSNTLPVRVTLDEEETIAALLQRVRQRFAEQRRHQHASLAEVLRQSEVPSGSMLFETLLAYDGQQIEAELRRLDSTWLQRSCTLLEQPGVPLTLAAAGGSSLQLRLLFDRRRYSSANAGRLLRYLRNLLEQLPDARRVADLELLDQAERRQILHTWNDTARPFADELLIHQLFEQRAALMPDAPAVECDGRLLSYAELEQRANRLANALRARGVGRGQFVGLCLARGTDLVVAMLGISKSGAAYVPIDPEYPNERVEFMLKDTGATWLVTDGSITRTIDGVQRLRIDEAAVRDSPVNRPVAVAAATDVCYVIYTSGSTGQPKGVVLTHRAVVNTLEWVSREFDVRPRDRALFVTSPCFDLSVYDVFGMLGAGGTVVVATQAQLREPRELVRVLTERGISIWNSAPAALQRLVPLLPERGGQRLRLVMLSGDWIPLTLPDAMRAVFPAASIVSLGGATEAAIWSNWYPVGAIDPRWSSIPYGRPIQNTQYHVLDQRCQPVPAGVSGDLYIAGACLAQGYLNRPELTAERFLANPFHPGERMYRTGDLARYFDDGVIEFLGRADFQVKIRGYRVELGEVEAALLAQPAVREAVCTAFTDVSGARALVAYLTARPGQSLDADAVRQELRRTLPDYMVPARIITLGAMPLSANGKIDRKALPAPVAPAPAARNVKFGSRAELKMFVIWRELLKNSSLDTTSHFFDLGGDSLLAVSLVLQIEKRFHRPFPLARVMEHPTLGAMAAAARSGHEPTHHVITLRANTGRRPPIFLFSGGGGYGFFYHALARRFGPEQPVHVFNAAGRDDRDDVVQGSIEDMAAIYAHEIHATSPEGPIIVGGYSFGAALAYAVARLLENSGREVPLMISFDGAAPGHPVKLSFGRRMLKHARDWRALDATGRRNYLKDRLLNAASRFMKAEDHPLLAPPPNVDAAMAQRLRRISAALSRARSQYHPQERLACPILLFKAEQPFAWPGHVTTAHYGWENFTSGNVITRIVPGSHLRFFGERNDGLLAGTIEERIAEYQISRTERFLRVLSPSDLAILEAQYSEVVGGPASSASEAIDSGERPRDAASSASA